MEYQYELIVKHFPPSRELKVGDVVVAVGSKWSVFARLSPCVMVAWANELGRPLENRDTWALDLAWRADDLAAMVALHTGELVRRCAKDA